MTPQETMLWAKKHWYVTILILLISLAVVLSIVQAVLQRFAPPPNAWDGVIPGRTTLDDVKKKLGDPIGTKQVGDQTVLSYTSDYPVYPHEVFTKDGTVLFVKEWVSPDSTQLLSDYIAKYGDPEFNVLTKESGDAYALYVFASKGVGVDAHQVTGKVFHVWYFKPMTQEGFRAQFADYITELSGTE